MHKGPLSHQHWQLKSSRQEFKPSHSLRNIVRQRVSMITSNATACLPCLRLLALPQKGTGIEDAANNTNAF